MMCNGNKMHLFYRKVILLTAIFNTLCYGQEDLTNTECNQEIRQLLLSNDVSPSDTNGISSNCVLNVSHPYLSAHRGFLPGETYQSK